MTAQFHDRGEAGRQLAARLGAYAHRDDVIVLALPRGGVPVGAEVASALDAPLDVFVVRKLGVPGHEELAMGAIASGGVRVIDEYIVAQLGVSDEQVRRITEREQAELERRERQYRDDLPLPDLTGRTVILVDDGLATGATMRAAVQAVRAARPAKVVVAVPVGARDTCASLRQIADDVVCPVTPDPFLAVGIWYADFDQTTDEEVEELLARTRRAHTAVRR